MNGSLVCVGGRKEALVDQVELSSTPNREIHWLGREGGGEWSRNAHAIAPNLPYQVRASHVPLSLTSPFMLHSETLHPTAAADRGLGFEEHLWMLDRQRGGVNLPSSILGFSLLLIPVIPLWFHYWQCCIEPCYSVSSKDQPLCLVRNGASPA